MSAASDRCWNCGGDAGDNWFDRSICPEPCNSMHTRCSACGVALDACPFDGSKLAPDGSAEPVAALCPHCVTDVPGPGEPYLCSGCGKPFLVAASPAPDDGDERAAGEHEVDPRADVSEGLASAGGAGGSSQGVHADEYRAVTAAPERYVKWAAEAEEQLDTALAALRDPSGITDDVLSAITLGELAYRIALNERSEDEWPDEVELECICPPELVARGGFKGGCPVHA